MDVRTQTTNEEENLYLSAVKGRSDFRDTYRCEREARQALEKKVDAYGLALMMIASGCDDAQDFAIEQLRKQGVNL